MSQPTVAKVSRVEVITWPLCPAVSEPPMVWRCDPLGHHRDVARFAAIGLQGRLRTGSAPVRELARQWGYAAPGGSVAFRYAAAVARIHNSRPVRAIPSSGPTGRANPIQKGNSKTSSA